MSRDARLAKLEQRRAKAERAKNLPLSIRWANAEGEVEIPPAGSDPLVRLHLTPGGGDAGAGPLPDADERVVTPSPPPTPTSRGRRAPEPAAVKWCTGDNPDCQICLTLDAMEFARRQQRAERRPAVGLAFRPLDLRRAW